VALLALAIPSQNFHGGPDRNLEANLLDLLDRIKSGRYKAPRRAAVYFVQYETRQSEPGVS
jgi:hypothetical protein